MTPMTIWGRFSSLFPPADPAPDAPGDAPLVSMPETAPASVRNSGGEEGEKKLPNGQSNHGPPKKGDTN